MTGLSKIASDVLPPRLVRRLRAEKSRRDLFGLHAPGSLLTSFVPPGRLAVDAGANAGLYAWWIARAASQVMAFEPHPDICRKLERLAPSNVTALNVALSDHSGTATLHVPPAGFGEASLQARGKDIEAVAVELRTLDSYQLDDLGFLKVDVEGHEESLLRGAASTIQKFLPTVFIEIEERHNPGSLERIPQWFTDRGYAEAYFMTNGQLHPFRDFDLARDQLATDKRSPSYANNFLFRAPA